MFRLLLSNLIDLAKSQQITKNYETREFFPVGWKNLRFATCEGLRRYPTSPCTLTWQHQGPGLSPWAACRRGPHLSMFSFKTWGQNSLKIGKDLVKSHLVLEELKEELDTKKMYCHYMCCVWFALWALQFTYWLIVKLLEYTLNMFKKAR